MDAGRGQTGRFGLTLAKSAEATGSRVAVGALVGAVAIVLAPVALAQQQAPASAAERGAKPAPAAKPTRKPAAGAAATAGAAGAAASAAADPDRAQKSFEAGVAAHRAGRHDEAAAALDTAIKAGGLPPATMAKALYYRGATHHAKGRPGQAISDLTSSLWFKGGLSNEERADATRIRSEAYQAAGLTDQGGPAATAGSTVAAASPPSASGSAPGSSLAQPRAKSNSSSGILGGLFDTTTTEAVAAPATPALAAAPTEPTATPSLGLPSMGNMFGNLFGGPTGSAASAKPIETGTSAPRAPAQAVAAAQSAPPSAPPPTQSAQAATQLAQVARSAAAAEPEVLPWAAGERAAGQPVAPPAPIKPAPAQPAAAKPPAPPKPQAAPAKPASAKPAKASGYRIQVGAVKTEAEAKALAERVKSNPAFSAMPVTVDKATFGTMGTFYRVNVGPFADAAAAKSPCDALKRGGFDCLVTAR